MLLLLFVQCTFFVVVVFFSFKGSSVRSLFRASSIGPGLLQHRLFLVNKYTINHCSVTGTSASLGLLALEFKHAQIPQVELRVRKIYVLVGSLPRPTGSRNSNGLLSWPFRVSIRRSYLAWRSGSTCCIWFNPVYFENLNCFPQKGSFKHMAEL